MKIKKLSKYRVILIKWMTWVWNILVTSFVLDILSYPILKRELKILLLFLLNHLMRSSQELKTNSTRFKNGGSYSSLTSIENPEQEPVTFFFYYLNKCLR